MVNEREDDEGPADLALAVSGGGVRATLLGLGALLYLIDTGFHFAETLATVRRALARYSLNLTVLRPSASAADLWHHGTDTCCGSRTTR